MILSWPQFLTTLFFWTSFAAPTTIALQLAVPRHPAFDNNAKTTHHIDN